MSIDILLLQLADSYVQVFPEQMEVGGIDAEQID